jgi:3-methylcrotonyl-CoA carboxylase alpha subunit
MFDKILIANRGEIACRIMQTAQQNGVICVAVYSDADQNALHVRMADEAHHIGGAAAADSYLKADVILEVAKRTGAQAIHPGYGFLSENAAFSRACEAAGIKFIGPSADAIDAMGLKDKAKDIMHKAGVPVVPGYQGAGQEPKMLSSEAEKIGFPVLIKAVAGGGGKGMRLVEKAADFAEMLRSCQREAKASFGNDHVLIEKYIQKPRHIEVQVFGDMHGNAVHLFERDCSLQRRHQKVVEEAPAPSLPPKVQQALGDAAVKAVKALGYENAGTIEFIMDSKTYEFFFMEMNTRLQVEHPVTEMITGQNLVRWQLEIAAGYPIPLSQDEIKINGHAFEVRLYAEDPATMFLPQTGIVHLFEGTSQMRLDTGIEAGDAISIHYDPMVAKIITHGKDRADAARLMQNALAQTKLAGLKANQEFLRNIFDHKSFLDEDIDTGFIERHFKDLVPETYGIADKKAHSLMCLYKACAVQNEMKSVWNQNDNWRGVGAFSRSIEYVHNAQNYVFDVCKQGDDYVIEGENVKANVQHSSLSVNEIKAVIDGDCVTASVFNDAQKNVVWLLIDGQSLVFETPDYDALATSASGYGLIIAPMPGKIIDVLTKAGDSVKKDQPLIVMEAMKMEMTIRADHDGVVEQLPVAVNDQVQDGALLVAITKSE